LSAPDPYKVLQVDPEAEDEVIEAAYRRLARKYHPDVSPEPEAQARMIAINQAWEQLRHPLRRAAVDRARRRTATATATVVAAGVEARAAYGPAPSASGRTEGEGSAGPPPGRPSGSVLTFGRYLGWSLGEIARVEPGYLEWLDRMPIGRPFQAEIDSILRARGVRTSDSARESGRGGPFGRR